MILEDISFRLKCKTGDEAGVEVSSEFKDGILDIYVETAKPVEFSEIGIVTDYKFDSEVAFFGNGYQSWTDTKEYRRGARMRDIGLLHKNAKRYPIMKNAGDYGFAYYKPCGHNFFHSVSYTYLRRGERLEFIGSLNERAGYTVIYADMSKNQIKITKDLEGKTISGRFKVFSLLITEGGYDEVFDKYFNALGAKLRTAEPLWGYTSWYNYYGGVTEADVMRDLENLAKDAPQITAFQIDDGYQTKVGDWLSVDAVKFPNGMKYVADAIHAKGIKKAGLWLAPLGASHDSKLLAEHPDWFFKGTDGKPKFVGHNWGNFAGLNFYLPEVRAHIKKFFDVVLNEWGFDLVKLDFLYAASGAPYIDAQFPEGKTRAECMYDAMEFIRECVGDKEILACGVPLIPCINMVEYMRIGADMGLSWSQFLYGKLTNREDVNTRNAIHNLLNRRHFNGRAFLCDPDVFLLRDYRIKLTWEQRQLLARLIKITGGVLFTSDDTGRYGEEQKKLLAYMFSKVKFKVQSVDLRGSVYTVKYTEDDVAKTLRFCLREGKVLGNS